jgi:hypothetical protein
MVLFDLDQQESAVMWADRRKTDSPHVEFVAERRLFEGLRAAEKGSSASQLLIHLPPQGRRILQQRKLPISFLYRVGQASLTSMLFAALPNSSSQRGNRPLPYSTPRRTAPPRYLKMPVPLSKGWALLLVPLFYASVALIVPPDPTGRRFWRPNPGARPLARFPN